MLVAAQPVDFRKGMDALAGLVAECLSENPYAGTDQRQAAEMNVGVAVLNRMLELGRPKSVRIA